MKEQRDELANALIELAESGMGLMKSSQNADPAAADRLNKAITTADAALEMCIRDRCKAVLKKASCSSKAHSPATKAASLWCAPAKKQS